MTARFYRTKSTEHHDEGQFTEESTLEPNKSLFGQVLPKGGGEICRFGRTRVTYGTSRP